MTLYDVVKGKDFSEIEVRLYGLDGEDDLFGFCSYVNGELKSLDGDSYSLDEEVDKWVIINDVLIIVEHTEYFYADGTTINTKDIEVEDAIARLKEEREGK